MADLKVPFDTSRLAAMEANAHCSTDRRSVVDETKGGDGYPTPKPTETASPTAATATPVAAGAGSSSVQFARLATYVSSAVARYNEVHKAQPQLGLKLQLGPREACRLLAAVERHGRAEQFAQLRLPFDVLLRVLALLPTAFDRATATRVAQSAALNSPLALAGRGGARVTQAQESLAAEATPRGPSPSSGPLGTVGAREEFARKAQMRAAATCSMLLMAVMENGHVLGGAL